MKTTEQIANEVLALFARFSSKPGHLLPPRALTNYHQTLNPKESPLLNEAINSLLAQEYLALKTANIPDSFTLTPSGYEFLYPVDREQVFEDIKGIILSQFRSANALVGHFIPNRSLKLPRLNPREVELVTEALENLVDQGYISIKTAPLPGIVLSTPGFDYIYQ